MENMDFRIVKGEISPFTLEIFGEVYSLVYPEEYEKDMEEFFSEIKLNGESIVLMLRNNGYKDIEIKASLLGFINGQKKIPAINEEKIAEEVLKIAFAFYPRKVIIGDCYGNKAVMPNINDGDVGLALYYPYFEKVDLSENFEKIFKKIREVIKKWSMRR